MADTQTAPDPKVVADTAKTPPPAPPAEVETPAPKGHGYYEVARGRSIQVGGGMEGDGAVKRYVKPEHKRGGASVLLPHAEARELIAHGFLKDPESGAPRLRAGGPPFLREPT